MDTGAKHRVPVTGSGGRRRRRRAGLLAGTLLLGSLSILPARASHLTGPSATYTTNADFDEGTLINVAHPVPDQLQLDDTINPFPFIWVAASGRGTIIKIDTATGTVKGEYWSAPDGRGRDPSRTTVDQNGSVWAGNRAEGWMDGKGSIVHVGLLENGQCDDRNGNGLIETSTGLGDILSWSNAGGADDAGGVTTAEDECLIHYVRTTGTGVRTLAVDEGNDVWAGGLDNAAHEKIDSATGAIVPGTTIFPGMGGYGGLIDGNGILWSATLWAGQVLRIDTNMVPPTWSSVDLQGHTSYGLGIDSQGNVWHSNFCDGTIQKIDPAGTLLGTFPVGGGGCGRGVAVTKNDDNVWVANSGGSDVSRLDNAGNILAVIPVGICPTGVSVDAAGKVWATNLCSDDASRIDPATNTVDLTVGLGPGASPYNYSDMTGSILTGVPDSGTWTIVHDSGEAGAVWGTVSWTADVFGDGALTVKAASGEDGLTFGPSETAANGGDLSVANGRYLRVSVSFQRASGGESPILYDLSVNTQPPIATTLEAEPAVARVIPGLWLFLEMRATLTEADGGAPVPGALIRFFTQGEFLCEATTNGLGIATCGGPVHAANSTVGLGYLAVFDGNATHLGSSDSGPVVEVAGADIP